MAKEKETQLTLLISFIIILAFFNPVNTSIINLRDNFTGSEPSLGLVLLVDGLLLILIIIIISDMIKRSGIKR